MPQLVDAPSAHHAGFPRGPRAGPSRDAAGLATLEWLLVIAAAGGFAAVMAVGFQGLIDDATAIGDDADARLIDAGITAARVSDEAVAALIALETSSGDPERTAVAQAALTALAQRCESVETAYPDVVESANWVWLTVPVEIPTPASAAPDDGTQTPALTGGRWVCQIGHHSP